MFINLRSIGGYVLLVVGILTVLSAIGTFFGTLDALLGEWGMGHLTVLFGILKLIAGALLIWDPTRLAGALVACSYFGGAIATHVAFESFNVQFVVVIIVTLALWFGVLTSVYGQRQ